MMPTFRYQPQAYENGSFEPSLPGETCDRCSQASPWLRRTVYTVADLEAVCPACIADGSAAQEFDAEFVQDAERVDDPTKRAELFQRTPGYESWQGEYWLTHCGDYCAFLSRVGTAELEEQGIADEVFADFDGRTHFDTAWLRQNMDADGDVAGYLFRCLTCGTYRIWADLS